MKRLHIVGKSKDNKRLYLAQKKDAKFGSFEIPIGRKLLRLIEEVQQGREERSRPARQAAPANQGDSTGVRVLPPDPATADGGQGAAEAAAAAARSAEVPQPGPQRQLRIAPDDIDIPIDVEDGQDAPVASVPAPSSGTAAQPGAPLFAPEPPPSPAVGPLPEPEVEAPVRVRSSRPEPTRHRPEIPARSKLSPAEIQALIRAGRGVRAVANMARTPVAWVKYLAEPIQQERLGIVQQMLGARQERARLGASSAPIGESILANLRGKGVRSPESVFDQGFTAHRPNGREWRVRLVFDHRGSRYAANWSFDPQTREVTPLNSMATQLGWRRQPTDDTEEPKPRPRSTGRTSRSKSPSKSPSRSKAASRRGSARTRKKTATRKSSSKRTAAARKSTRKRTATRRSSKKKSSRARSTRR